MNQVDYRETRELANWLIFLNSVESTESANSLKMFHTPNMAAGLHDSNSLFLFLTTNPGSGQNNVKRGLEVQTNNVESCEDNQPSLRGGVQRLCGSLRPAQNLQVTNCHLQNQLSLSESDSPPSLRGAVHSITGSNPVHRANAVPVLLVFRTKEKGRNLPFRIVRCNKKGIISNPTLWLAGYRQTTENPAVNSDCTKTEKERLNRMLEEMFEEADMWMREG